MIPLGRKTCQNFGVIFWAVCVVWLLAIGSDVGARQRARGRANVRQGREVAEEARNVQKISETILVDFISKNIPLVAEDIEAIEEELGRASRYLGKFNSEQKAYYYLVQAYLDHFSENPKKDAVLAAQKAYKSDSENMDATTSLIALSLYYGKYSIARKVLQELDAGEAVVIEAKPKESGKGHKKGRLADGSENDPNTANSSRSDPNSGGSRMRGHQRGGSEKKNKWAQRRRQQKQGPAGGMMPGMMPGMQPGMQPGMMPGMGPGYQVQTRKPVALRRHSSGKTHLDIPYEYMPYAHLGETFQSLNVRNVNGSFYQYDSGQGQILCILLWMLPEDGGALRYTPRRVPSNVAIDQMPVQKVAYDLWGNVDQFRELYRFHRQSGKAQFVTVNLDTVTSQNVRQVEELFMDSSWPWVNFMAQDVHQAKDWKFKELYSQVMVIVDPEGTIRYMGPVGGFLPLMLLDAQLPHAQADAQSLQFVQKPSSGQKQPSKGSLLEKGSSSTTQAPGTATKPTLTLRKASSPHSQKSVEKSTSNLQAQRMMQLAKVKKRVSLRGAMTIYDDVINQFPDTEQAEIARMYIKKICRNNLRMRKERTKQGKYTGYE